jgi:glycosyltransferase involved in cell wall biosynthesis
MKEIITNPFVKYPLYLLLSYFEKITYSKAQHINLVSEGFKGNFKAYKQAKFTFYPNGIDDMFLNLTQNPGIIGQKPQIITYAGNIGEGQGLHKILIDSAKQLKETHIFRIIGDGGTKHLIEEEIAKQNITNIEILNPVNREKLLEYYKQSHFLFLHLNSYKAFEKVLPSKLFEYGATNIPIIAGVSGFANEFIKVNLRNTILFKPCDSNDLVKELKNYTYLLQERNDFIEKYRRDNISYALSVSINSYLK